MPHKEDQFKQLLSDYALGKLTEEEEKKLEHLLIKHPIDEKWAFKSMLHKAQFEKQIEAGIKKQIKKTQQSKRFILMIAASAAAVLVLFFIGLRVYHLDDPKPEVLLLASEKNIGIDQVRIQQADGKQMLLDEKVDFLDLRSNKELVAMGINKAVFSNVQVPAQRQFKLILTDGTAVWLNAGAELQVPSDFSTAGKRQVKLNGEAYFEVKSDTSNPFFVETYESTIQVTGTKFNVRSYPEESRVETSLLEGKVVFNTKAKAYQISPGRMIQADMQHMIIEEADFNADDVLAWKEGYFTFNNLDIFQVMQTVSKWYNVTVKAEKNINHTKIGGSFPKELPLSELLKDLTALSGVKFEIRGKEVLLLN